MKAQSYCCNFSLHLFALSKTVESFQSISTTSRCGFVATKYVEPLFSAYGGDGFIGSTKRRDLLIDSSAAALSALLLGPSLASAEDTAKQQTIVISGANSG